MITEDYVSFETAKLLKEKGFDVNTFTKYADKEGATEKWYDDYRERMVRFEWDCGTLITPPTEPHDKYEVYGDTISAPTLQMAMKWLRQVYGLFIRITEDMTGNVFEWSVYQKNYGCKASTYVEESYEQACETAIKYCLKNLI